MRPLLSTFPVVGAEAEHFKMPLKVSQPPVKTQVSGRGVPRLQMTRSEPGTGTLTESLTQLLAIDETILAGKKNHIKR